MSYLCHLCLLRVVVSYKRQELLAHRDRFYMVNISTIS